MIKLSDMNKGIIILILRILLGATFIFSGIVKLDSIYQFEQTIFKAGITDWTLIPWLSRLLIGAEIFLGICFFHKEGLKKFTIPATFALLVIFCVHLGYTIIMEGGSSGNCGCFGEKIPMTPNQSLIKNIVMLAMLVYMYKVPYQKPAREVAVPISLGILSFLLLFFFFPIKSYVTTADAEKIDSTSLTVISRIDSTLTIDSSETERPDNEDEKNKELNVKKEVEVKKASIQKTIVSDTKTKDITKTENTDSKQDSKVVPGPSQTTSKFAPFKNFNDGATANLDEGIKIVAMYNTGCDHCMENAKKMCEIGKKTKLPPGYILFWGSENEVPAFFEFATCSKPYKILEPQVFFPLLGKGNFPQLTLLYNGNILGQWEGDDAPEKIAEAVRRLNYN